MNKLLVPLAGATPVFALNAACFLLVVLAAWQWKRPVVPAKLPSEAPAKQLPDRATLAGQFGASRSIKKKRIHETQFNDPAVEIVEEIRALQACYQRGARNPRPPDPLAFWRRYSA
jgi:hypothetical protein